METPRDMSMGFLHSGGLFTSPSTDKKEREPVEGQDLWTQLQLTLCVKTEVYIVLDCPEAIHSYLLGNVVLYTHKPHSYLITRIHY